MPDRRRAANTKAPAESSSSILADAHAALARGDWEDARVGFDRATREAPTPGAWEGLAIATSYLEQADVALAAREEAFRRYREARDARGAVRCAVWLASDVMEFRGDPAVANGWIQRAQSILEEIPEPSAEGAMLLAFRAHMALRAENDLVTAHRLSHEALTLSRGCGAVDEEMIALSVEGLALVTEGRVAEGMSHLDEATTAAVAGEMRDPNLIATACCILIQACAQVRDYSRAAQWCERVRVLADRWRMGSFFVYCRTQYASILMSRGQLALAESELEAATRHAEKHRPALVRGAVVRMADLRRRQGRFVEAEALLESMGAHPLAVLGRAELALGRGRETDAVDLLEGLLRRIPPTVSADRTRALEVLTRAYVTAQRFDDAQRTVNELVSIADVIGTESLRGAASAARGVLFAATSQLTEARHALEDAIARYESGGEQHDAAHTHLELAKVLHALGKRTSAVAEVKGAVKLFEQMGAAADAHNAKLLARTLEGRPRRRGLSAPSELSPRELDVLRLVAGGAGDKAIARRLRLSEHTIHRHIANILRKLNVSSRAAAVAQAARLQLLQ